MNPPTFETELLRRLRELPVDPPAPGFAARVLGPARSPLLQPALGLALAASLVVALGAGTWLGLRDSVPGLALDPKVMILVPDEVHPVSLVFRSDRALRDVTFELSIPAGVELAGRAGRTELRWTTDLQVGANRLDLPVIVRRGGSGAIVARLSHGQDHKQFTVLVKSREPVET